MRAVISKLFIATLLLVFLSSSTREKPSILIIGDSISIGYTPFVKESLLEKANVFHNPGNAQHTGTGVEKIEEWIGDVEWDIVQFNWGLWDLCYRHPDSKVQGNRDKVNGKLTYTVEEYTANLDAIVSKLQKLTDAKLIFLTTSYVPEHEAGRFAEDAIRYNEAAKKIMEKYAITVNDIYERSIPIHQKYGKGTDDVHYRQEGYEQLGELVTKFLQTELATMKRK